MICLTVCAQKFAFPVHEISYDVFSFIMSAYGGQAIKAPMLNRPKKLYVFEKNHTHSSRCA